MYEIYINESKLLLAKTRNLQNLSNSYDPSLMLEYSGDPAMLLNHIDTLEKSEDYREYLIHSTDYKKLKSDFKSQYRIIEAGGGLILNELNEILFIHRRGFWDLPKGKLDVGESSEQGAIREVMEETGIKAVILKGKLYTSKHTYKAKQGKRLIKKTKWYLMEGKKQVLIPQLEEDIKKAVWMSIEAFKAKERKVYSSIKDVLAAHFKAQ